ncbi:MAG: tRNA (guanosine(37)-N1)-methyltransferase TrmD [Acidobacteria bacterium]|nr:tRNA (guanosine(37)-N1)-methyltransferase TrmD [Acidobacteriota bacterium]
MRFDLITIFPKFFAGPLDYGIVRRAREAGIAETHVHDLRNWAHDKHRTVDDRPFGGGEGMVMKPEPIFEAVESLTQNSVGADFKPAPTNAIVLLSASGKKFRQVDARRFAALERIVLICGRYEGVDERVAEHLATDELCIGDFVLSGGELAAAMIVDAVTRLLPGALGNEDSSMNESFSSDAVSTLHSGLSAIPVSKGSGASDTGHPTPNSLLLDFPHYTRPAEFRGWRVPEVLMNGNHEEIRRWRRDAALEKTRRNRPDLFHQ